MKPKRCYRGWRRTTTTSPKISKIVRSRYCIPRCCRSVIVDATTQLISSQYFLQLAAKPFGGEGLGQPLSIPRTVWFHFGYGCFWGIRLCGKANVAPGLWYSRVAVGDYYCRYLCAE